MRTNALQDRLRQFQRRLLLIGLGASAGWALLTAVLLLMLCMWLDLALELPSMPRAICGVGALGAGLLLVVALAFAAWKRTAPQIVARRLDQTANARGQILSGVDLMMQSPQSGAALSAGMAQLAVQRAVTLSTQISAGTAISAKPIVQPILALTGVAIVIVTVVIALPRLAATQWARFTDPFGDHPAYSRTELEVIPGDAKVAYGGSLDLRAIPRGEPIESMDLILRGQGAAEEKLPMFPEPGGAWRATLTNVTSPAQYTIRATGGARSHRFNITVVTVPKIQSVRFRVTPPAYTNRPPIEGPLPSGGLSALPGTIVQVMARSNRPLSGGTVAFDVPQAISRSAATQPAPATAIALSPVAAGSNEVTGSFIVQSAGRLDVRVTDVNGQDSTESISASITVLRDERPFVRILEPKPESFATPDTLLNIELLGEDDYGISRLELFRTLNESRARSTEVAIPRPYPTRLPAMIPLPLASYALSPGDVVKLYARVEDNDPNGPKGSESPVVVVRIISAEQLRQMLLAREGLETLLSKYEQAVRRMEKAAEQLDKLRKELERADPNSELAKDLREKLSKLAEQMQQDANELAEMAANDLPFDVDHALKKHLEAAARKMEMAAARMKKAAGSQGIGSGAVAKEVAEAQKELAQERQEYQQEAQEPLEHLAKIFPLIEDQSRFIELWERQKDLAQRMDSLIGHNGEDDPRLKARMRDLQQEQEQIRKELKNLLDDIDNRVAELPPDPRLDDLRKSASEFARAVRDSTASDDMSQAEAALGEFNGSKSAAASVLAAEDLEKFIGRCKGVGQQGQACMKFQPKLAEALGNSVEQLLEAEGLGASGQGAGGMGGYSARRSSLRNVGLYGGLPLQGKESRGQGGHADHGVSSDGTGSSRTDDSGLGANGNRLSAFGQSEAAVPDRYKRRVGEYFKRVADELEENK